MDDFESAKQLALSFIDYAPRTRAEVARRLARAEYGEEVVEAVIADLERGTAGIGWRAGRALRSWEPGASHRSCD